MGHIRATVDPKGTLHTDGAPHYKFTQEDNELLEPLAQANPNHRAFVKV